MCVYLIPFPNYLVAPLALSLRNLVRHLFLTLISRSRINNNNNNKSSKAQAKNHPKKKECGLGNFEAFIK